MRRIFCIAILMLSMGSVRAQHVFRGTSLSEALIELDQSSPQYDVSFVYDELEDFTVSCTVGKDVPLPDAVRQVCGFYPVRVIMQGREIFVECMQKSQTKLIGRLVDAAGHPVAYANIALFNAADQTTPAEDCSIKTQSPTQDVVLPLLSRRLRLNGAIAYSGGEGLRPHWRRGE